MYIHKVYLLYVRESGSGSGLSESEVILPLLDLVLREGRGKEMRVGRTDESLKGRTEPQALNLSLDVLKTWGHARHTLSIGGMRNSEFITVVYFHYFPRSFAFRQLFYPTLSSQFIKREDEWNIPRGTRIVIIPFPSLLLHYGFGRREFLKRQYIISTY
jgi:hypothetical protein